MDLITDKQQQIFFSPPEKDNALDRAQMWWFMELYGNPRQYQPSRYAPSISYGVSQKINDSLSTFKKIASFTSAADGLITLPVDYVHLLALNTNEVSAEAGRTVYRPVQILNEDELVERLESQLCPVSVSDPIGIINSTLKIQLFPQVTQVGKLYYLRKPVAPVYGYTQTGRVITYDPLTSTQLEWDDPNVNQIMIKALEFLGMNMGETELVQMMDAKDKEGI